MSKIVFVGDLHAGARGDSQVIANYQFRFFEELLFPYIDEHGIKDVVFFGDVFDKRKNTSHDILHQWKERVFSELDKRVSWNVLVGNHDLPFRNSVVVNSPSLFLSDYSNIKLFYEPTEHEICGVNFLILPWICSGNEVEVFEAIKNSQSQFCFGHLELSGFQMNKGYVIEEGMDRARFSKFDRVFSGHYHTQSESGNVKYLGTPYELTWIDADDPKGFWVFDTTTHHLSFVRNPFIMFNKVVYDSSSTLNRMLKDTYVKLVVADKGDQKKYEAFVESIIKLGVADLKIIDDLHVDLDDADIDDIDVDDTKSIIETLCEQVDGVSDNDRNNLKVLMQGLYVEALSTID